MALYHGELKTKDIFGKLKNTKAINEFYKVDLQLTNKNVIHELQKINIIIIAFKINILLPTHTISWKLLSRTFYI